MKSAPSSPATPSNPRPQGSFRRLLTKRFPGRSTRGSDQTRNPLYRISPTRIGYFTCLKLLPTAILSAAGAIYGQAPIQTGLHAWFKADAGLTVDGGAVTAWADQSGNGFMMSPPGTAPTVTNAALGSLPAVTFNGSSQLNGDLGAVPLTDATIFALFRYTVTDSNNDYLYAFGSDGGSGSQLTLSRQSGGRAYHFDGALQKTSGNGAMPSNNWLVTSQVFGEGSGTEHRLAVNSSTVLLTNATAPYSANVSTAIIGNWTSGSYRFIGDLVELLVYDRALDLAERTSVEEYLRERAGLPEFFKSEAEILSNWDIIQYEFGTQGDAQWSFDLGGTRADQAVNADASILLSDIDVADKVIWGQFGSGTAPDFMGFVFGYQNSREFYLFDWKKSTASYSSFGTAGLGMRLTVFHVDGEEPTGRDFWASDRSQHTTVLLENDIPWGAGLDYDFSLKFEPGSFTIRVWSGETVLESWTVNDATYTSGRFGYFINSLQGVRFGQVFVNDAGPIAIDRFERGAEQVNLRWLGGEPPYVIETSENLADGFTPTGGHIWNRVSEVPATGDKGFYLIRSVGAELSTDP